MAGHAAGAAGADQDRGAHTHTHTHMHTHTRAHTHTQKPLASLPQMSVGPPLMPRASRGACLLVDPHTTPGVKTKKKTTVKTSDDEVDRLDFGIVSVGEGN